MDKLTEIERLVSIGIIQEDIYSIMPRIYGKSLCT